MADQERPYCIQYCIVSVSLNSNSGGLLWKRGSPSDACPLEMHCTWAYFQEGLTFQTIQYCIYILPELILILLAIFSGLMKKYIMHIVTACIVCHVMMSACVVTRELFVYYSGPL